MARCGRHPLLAEVVIALQRPVGNPLCIQARTGNLGEGTVTEPPAVSGVQTLARSGREYVEAAAGGQPRPGATYVTTAFRELRHAQRQVDEHAVEDDESHVYSCSARKAPTTSR